MNAVFTQLAISFGLGLLLGLQRERAERSIGGIRTFPLIALLGTVCAQLSLELGGWIVGAGFIGLAAIVISANAAKLRSGQIDPGMTTEVSTLLLYALGAMIVMGSMGAAVVVGGVMALLLHLKEPMHRFAGAVGDRDMRAMMQFVLLSLVILPVLPREDFGPFGVWNPFEIWLMVVLIVGISLGGYVAYKLLGAHAGTFLGGLLGGLISRTATTVSYARRTRENPEIASLAALVIMIASCVSLARVLVEIGAVAPKVFVQIAPPLAAMLAFCALVAGALFLLSRRREVRMPEQKNPAELKPALIFGGLYALILLAVAVARRYFGEAGLYVVGVLSGLTDMDAITLSSAKMAATGTLPTDAAWRTILIAAMSNFTFKFGTVAVLGSRALTQRVGLAFLVALLGGGSILWLWPGAPE